MPNDSNVKGTLTYCVVCKSEVVVELSHLQMPFNLDMVVGHEDAGDPVIKTYYCSNPECNLMYRNPPGKKPATDPVMDDLKARQAERERQASGNMP